MLTGCKISYLCTGCICAMPKTVGCTLSSLSKLPLISWSNSTCHPINASKDSSNSFPMRNILRKYSRSYSPAIMIFAYWLSKDYADSSIITGLKRSYLGAHLWDYCCFGGTQALRKSALAQSIPFLFSWSNTLNEDWARSENSHNLCASSSRFCWLSRANAEWLTNKKSVIISKSNSSLSDQLWSRWLCSNIISNLSR